MPPGSMKLKDSSCKKRPGLSEANNELLTTCSLNHEGFKETLTKLAHRNCYDWNTSWSNRLKEISCLLPVSEPSSGQALSKKETLIHMLRYFDFLQTHIQRLQSNLPPYCLPETNNKEESDSESEDTAHSDPNTPPRILKAKRKYSWGRPRKKDTLNSELFDDKNQTLHKEDANRNVRTITNGECPHTQAADETVWPPEDNNSLPCSSDSNCSIHVLLPAASSSTAGSSVDQESPCQGLGSQCSICDDRTGSEDGSEGNKELASPPGSFILKDRMFGVLPLLGKNQLDDSPTLPQTPVLPFLPLLGFREGLNLSPSLLTSPARGLSHTLLPEGQEELQTLFEDVWVTPKPAASKHCRHDNDGHAWSQSEEEGRFSDDITWTPNQRIHMKKGSKRHRKRVSRKGQAVSGPSQKKKCVNGFIMFCRMNRRLYLRTHPGLPSTVVTKELANLWHIMPKQEKHVYCLKARKFSRQHNRNVRSEGQEAEEEAEDCVLRPLHILLAHRDLGDLWVTATGKS